MQRVCAVARKVGRLTVTVTLLIVLPRAIGSARGEIYEWVDDAGARHFDNSLNQVPEERRAEAKVVVNGGQPSPDAPSGSTASDAPAPASEQSASEESFDAGWDSGFRAGWESGYRAAVDEQPECPAQPELVVLQSQPPVVVNVPRYDPSGAYYRSAYDGVVTMPFDDGASFGLTGRGRIQQQRALERGW